MKLFRNIALAITLAVVAACTTTPTANGPRTAQQTVFQAEATYNSAAIVVQAYLALPRCGTLAATAICSSPTVVAQLKQADQIAYTSLRAAENVARTQGAGANATTALIAANQAVAALTSITATLQTK